MKIYASIILYHIGTNFYPYLEALLLPNNNFIRKFLSFIIKSSFFRIDVVFRTRQNKNNSKKKKKVEMKAQTLWLKFHEHEKEVSNSFPHSFIFIP